MSEYEGRLELTWTNKALRLLAQENGSYEWVPPSDYRVAEVRLLHDAGTVGEVSSDGDRARGNLLIRGDALNALTSLIELPELAREYVNKVKLAYLDPPFNTQQSFLQYDDALEHSVWLTMMRDRLIQVKTLLSSEGSVWVHCDDSEQAYLKVMMDEIFGRECFVTAFIWRKVENPNENKIPIAPDHDYILCYSTRPSGARFHRKLDPGILGAFHAKDEQGRLYRDWLLRKMSKGSFREDRPTMFFPITAPDGAEVYPLHPNGREGRWRLGQDSVERLVEQKGVIWKRRLGLRGEEWVPYTREYAPDVPRRPWPSIWADLETSRQTKAHLKELLPQVTPFATPKPEQLLERLLLVGTEPGDIVLDCFLGSGTTAAAAHKMGRRWIGIELNANTLSIHAIPRLTKVVEGQDPGGITESAGWEGGGGFRILDVAPSMFQADDGQVFLSEWATNGKLAEATAAQLHYDYAYDPPFCGRRGRSCLAVIDGLVNESVVQLLLKALPGDERLIICGTAVDPTAGEVLRSTRPGSSVRKIPQSILQEYRQTTRWVQPSLMDVAQNHPDVPVTEEVPV